MQCPNEDDRFSFIVEWYDPNATLVRKYILHFSEKESTVEMFDLKNNRSFLRRSKIDSVNLCDLYIGSTINVMARQLTIVDYANDYTRRRLGYKKERTAGFIKPDGMPNTSKVLDMIWQNGLQITKLKMMQFNRPEASEFYCDFMKDASFNELVSAMIVGPIIAFELRGENAVQFWKDLAGSDDPSVARGCNPLSIRAHFGSDCIRNVVHTSASVQAAERELEFLFPTNGPTRRNTACFIDSTCAIIKPHAIRDGIASNVIEKIMECGFEISAMMMVSLDKANAEEFLEVYKGVVQEYPVMVTELSGGACIAMEIRAQDAVKTFREFVGPADPEIARHLRPRSLRAMFGRTKAQNAVHCTDLPEDGQLEVEYFFKILDV